VRVLSWRSRLSRTWRLLLKELSAFGVVGAVCFVVELALFQYLYGEAGLDAVTTKLVATLVSVTIAFVGHRYWSFSHRERLSLGRQYWLFALVNAVTLGVSLLIVAVVRYPLGQESALVLQVANVASIVLSTVLRYLAYRRWVFPAHANEPDDARAEEAAQARIVA